jgi:hypothetical protein
MRVMGLHQTVFGEGIERFADDEMIQNPNVDKG